MSQEPRASSSAQRDLTTFTVVLLDDDARRAALGSVLRAAGYRVLEVHDHVRALRLVRSGVVDAVLVTAPTDPGGAPEMALVPTHVVTAEERQMLLAPERQPAHDNVTQELLLRVGVLCRRGREQRERAQALRVHLQLGDGTVTAGDTKARVGFTPTEFRLLSALVSAMGQLTRREQLSRALWDEGVMPSPNSLDSCVRRVRMKLADLGVPVELVTVRGVGYRLVLQ
jgi:two-component system OmpR family response regulator